MLRVLRLWQIQVELLQKLGARAQGDVVERLHEVEVHSVQGLYVLDQVMVLFKANFDVVFVLLHLHHQCRLAVVGLLGHTGLGLLLPVALHLVVQLLQFLDQKQVVLLEVLFDLIVQAFHHFLPQRVEQELEPIFALLGLLHWLLWKVAKVAQAQD